MLAQDLSMAGNDALFQFDLLLRHQSSSGQKLQDVRRQHAGRSKNEEPNSSEKLLCTSKSPSRSIKTLTVLSSRPGRTCIHALSRTRPTATPGPDSNSNGRQ